MTQTLKLVSDNTKAADPSVPTGRDRITVKGGGGVLEAARRGIELQRQGIEPNAAAKKCGLSRQTYTQVRDIVLLSERDDLPDDERALIRGAMVEVDKTYRVRDAWLRVRPIANRIWGRGNVRITGSRLKHRNAAFSQAIGFIFSTCESAAEIDVPAVPADQVEDAVTLLSGAIASLTKLRRRIIRETEHE